MCVLIDRLLVWLLFGLVELVWNVLVIYGWSGLVAFSLFDLSGQLSWLDWWVNWFIFQFGLVLLVGWMAWGNLLGLSFCLIGLVGLGLVCSLGWLHWLCFTGLEWCSFIQLVGNWLFWWIVIFFFHMVGYIDMFVGSNGWIGLFVVVQWPRILVVLWNKLQNVCIYYTGA